MPEASASPFTVWFGTTHAPGPRFACKEAFDVAGHPADAGHPAFAALRGSRPTSRAVLALQQAGYTLVGKTVASELLVSGLGQNAHHPTPRNAVDPDLVTGGSSIGCAVAVAAGEVAVSLATDTAGSTRIPAACHGIIGVSLAGTHPWLQDAVSLAPTIDQLGLIGRKWAQVSDAARALRVRHEGRASDTLLVPWDALESRCEPAHLERFRTWVATLPPGRVRNVAAAHVLDATDAEDERLGNLALREIASSVADLLTTTTMAIHASAREPLQARLALGKPSITEWHRLWEPLRSWRRGLRGAPLLMPTLPCTIPRLGQRPTRALGSLTKYTNVMGESAVSLPVEGLELSVQVVSPGWQDLARANETLMGNA